MIRIGQTNLRNLGNALLWGAMTFSILAGLAGLLWLVGAATGGN